MSNDRATRGDVGPCWHDSGMTWPNGVRPRCELRAGHAGAHECDRGALNGTAVWTETLPQPGVGWFADIDKEQPDLGWQPCLDIEWEGMIPCFEVWFRTREECEEFIRDQLIPAGGRMLDDGAA